MGESTDVEKQAVRDDEQLRILSVFYYVIGAFGFLFACFPIVHVLIGIGMILSSYFGFGADEVDLWMGWLFAGGGGFFLLMGWAFAGSLVFGGWSISQRQYYPFCIVVSILSCLFVPFGTILGVFSLVILLRESVQEQFGYGPRTGSESLTVEERKEKDQYHLWLLSIFHYVLAGFTILLSVGYLLYLGFFEEMMTMGFPVDDRKLKMPFIMTVYFYSLFGISIVIGVVYSVLITAVGINLQRQKHYTFCLVVSAINCVYLPFGTLLGVFTLMVLMRDTVKDRFGMHFAPCPQETSS